MKMLITNNLTGLDEEVEVESEHVIGVPEPIVMRPTDADRISSLETLILQIGGII